jgi:TusA-related sulfurtransferase
MKECPMHAEHRAQQAHHAVVESHGDQAMGFPQDKTTHHFRMMSDGGAIEVAVNDPSDKPNTEAIRSHLLHVTTMFGDGDFSIPMFVHDGVPPGMTTMKLMKSTIHYTYEEMPSGGGVRIESNDPIAVAAIHDFFRFQITDHQTGDTLEVAGK